MLTRCGTRGIEGCTCGVGGCGGGLESMRGGRPRFQTQIGLAQHVVQCGLSDCSL